MVICGKRYNSLEKHISQVLYFISGDMNHKIMLASPNCFLLNFLDGDNKEGILKANLEYKYLGFSYSTSIKISRI